MTNFLGCVDGNCEIIDQPVFTTDWFSSNINQWNQYKQFFSGKENMHCLEIGSWEGRSTIYTVENFCNGNGSYVDAIDAWDGADFYLGKRFANDFESVYERFIHNVKQYVDDGKVHIYRSLSADALMKFVQEVKAGARDKYDVIYIDGSHMGKDVLMDALLSWEILKKDGVMLFDDYAWDLYLDNPDVMRPKAAIDSFLKIYGGMYKILHKDYQMHIMKTVD